MPNRLAGETSPYLLQHAHNPVDWYPWGPEAPERPRTADRPNFPPPRHAACHRRHGREPSTLGADAPAAASHRRSRRTHAHPPRPLWERAAGLSWMSPFGGTTSIGKSGPIVKSP